MRALVGIALAAVAGTAAVVLVLALADSGGRAPGTDDAARDFKDAAGRAVAVPEQVDRVICSGPGSLRLLTYLGAQERAVAVDSIEKRRSPTDARPYALVHPEFARLPLFGEFRGRDSPELIVGLDPLPQVVLKADPGLGQDPDRLQSQTGVPVVVINYGNLTDQRADLNQALHLIGKVLGRSERAEAVIAFFDSLLNDLARRTEGLAAEKRPTCYVGAIAMRGMLGFRSTEPGYAPFAFTGARNVAAGMVLAEKGLSHAVVAKEQIVAWDPAVVFLDLSTVQLGASGGLHELRTDPAYRGLTAVRQGRVFGVLPHNFYTENFGSVLANAYFVGTVLHPEGFRDIDPAAKADEIYTFLLGAPVFQEMNRRLGGMAFERIPIDE